MQLREFHEAAKPLLKHDVIWFDEPIRELIAVGIARAALQAGYTFGACAILRNQLHLVIRTHRDDSLTMLTRIAATTFELLHKNGLVPLDHPVWSERPYKVFLKTAADLRGRIKYVWENPMKEGLAPQTWEFVKKYPR